MKTLTSAFSLGRRVFHQPSGRPGIGVLAELAAVLNRTHAIAEIVESSLQTLRSLVRPGSLDLYLRSDDASFLRWNSPGARGLPEMWRGEIRDAVSAAAEIALIIPLSSPARGNGALLVGKRPAGGSYSTEDEALLRLVASQMALALDRPRLVREISAEFAHELKKPLVTMALPVELCCQDLERLLSKENSAEEIFIRLSRRMNYVLNQVVEAGKRVDDLQRLKDPASLGLRPIPIARVVRACLSDQASLIRGADVEIDYSVPENLPLVEGDARQLEIAFTNLIRNALEAMGRVPLRRLSLAGQEREGRVEILVQDTGPGISEDDRGHVFEPHFSTKPGAGRGMGLSLVRQIVQACGGEISLTVAQPFGSCFRVALNRAA